MRIISILVLAAAMAQQPTNPVNVSLEWDAPTATTDGATVPILAGYKLYYGVRSGIYDTCIDVGNRTATTVIGLDLNTTYFFAATAYTQYGSESKYSDELRWTPKRMGTVIRLAADRPPRRLWIGRE